jgi:hypothetical protein
MKISITADLAVTGGSLTIAKVLVAYQAVRAMATGGALPTNSGIVSGL